MSAGAKSTNWESILIWKKYMHAYVELSKNRGCACIVMMEYHPGCKRFEQKTRGLFYFVLQMPCQWAQPSHDPNSRPIPSLTLSRSVIASVLATSLWFLVITFTMKSYFASARRAYRIGMRRSARGHDCPQRQGLGVRSFAHIRWFRLGNDVSWAGENKTFLFASR